MSEIKLNRIYRVKNHVMATKQAECIIPLSVEKNHWDGYSANYLLYKYYSVRCGKNLRLTNQRNRYYLCL